MCACPCCHESILSDATFCAACGSLLDAPRRPRVAPFPDTPGVTVRLVHVPDPSVIYERPRLAIGSTIRLSKAQASPVALQHIVPKRIQPIQPWRDVAVPLIALVFVIITVLGVASALAVVGVTARGLLMLAIPVAGALQAESTWLQGRWRTGLVSMVAWDVMLWMVATYQA